MLRVRRQLSRGGQAVEAELLRAGFGARRPGVSLVETDRPRLARPRAVLAQNSWNALPRREFWGLLRDYPVAMWPRFLARRWVAGVNLRRAERVVCLTESMGEVLRARLPRPGRVVVAPVWLPTDVLVLPSPSPSTDPDPSTDPVAVVPGTVTWFKDPGAALECAARLGIERVLYLGDRDASGAWEAVEDEAARRGIAVELRVADRASVQQAMRRARVVILPSRLESLGFGLGEALVLARHVVASPIDAHREVAARIGREPAWLPSVDDGADAPVVPDLGAVRASWVRVGEALGLPRVSGPVG